MRSPGFNRIIHTRTRSLSETSSLPTHGSGFFCSRSNSASISGGHTDLGVAITTRKILDSSGRLVSELECPQVLTAWERVYRVLRDAFPQRHYHRGCGVRGFEQTANSITADAGDRGMVECDLLVGA